MWSRRAFLRTTGVLGTAAQPAVVLDAVTRYLDMENLAPVYYAGLMNRNVETVRRGLAAEFGCDTEELAIARNASAHAGAQFLFTLHQLECDAYGVGVQGLEAGNISSFLWDKDRIIVAALARSEMPGQQFDCQGIRVTPNVYTPTGEVDTFVAAMQDLIKSTPA